MYIRLLKQIDKGNGLVELTGPCFGRKDAHYSVTVKRTELDAYLAGALMQRAFPNLTPDQREFLISGLCPKCWDETFSGVEE